MLLIPVNAPTSLSRQAADIATRLTGDLITSAMRGEVDTRSQLALGRVAMIVKASGYLAPKENEELATYLQLL